MQENNKINEPHKEEPKGAAYSTNKKGIAMQAPPYHVFGPPNKNEGGNKSLKAPVNPYQKYYIKSTKSNEKSKQDAGLFNSGFNSGYLERKTPVNERAQKEEMLRKKQTLDVDNGIYDHLSELDQTNNMVGADAVSNQYQSIMNPIRNAISSGKTPYDDSADRNQAVMASAAVYGGTDKYYAPTEWEISNLLDGKINLMHIHRTGFKFQLFEKEEVSDKGIKEKRYMLAFAGTEGFFNKDMIANLSEKIGQSAQYENAAELGRVVANLVGGADKVIFVGHSLGGGLASAASYATGSHAITFNAAAISKPTKENIKNKYKDINFSEREDNINAYVNAGEVLDYVNRIQGLKADGNFRYVKKKGESVLGKAKAKHGIENFFEIFNIDAEKLEEDYEQRLRANIPENFTDQYQNKAPRQFPAVKDYSGGLGTH